MRVKLTPDAELDLEEATAWYLARAGAQIARRFVEDYRHAKRLVGEAPTRWMELEPGIRRIVFHTFPYSLIYPVETVECSPPFAVGRTGEGRGDTTNPSQPAVPMIC